MAGFSVGAGRAAAVTAWGLAVMAAAQGLAADASHGEQLAKRWCAACHLVSDDQQHAADNVPTFASVGRRPGVTADRIARFLRNPHPKMPDMQLSRSESADLAAYIVSLGK